MSGPASIPFSSDGYELAVVSGLATPTGTRALMLAGSDGSNSRFLTIDSSGRPIVVGAGTAGTPAGGVVSIQGVAGGQAIPISGSVTATNAAVSTTGSAVPASASYTGGNVTTAAPTYTNNTMNALSLTTSGLLRVDGSGVTQPVSGTVTSNIGTTGGLALDTTLAKLTISQSTALGTNTQVLIGGSVTTAAPTYTTGNINPFSLTTSGALRVDGSGSTQPVSGTVAATQSGTWTVQPGNTANTTPWLITINQGGNSATVTASNALKVDGSAVTQPVSGTVTANAGTGNFNNASVSGTGSAPPASATYIGGSVTTAAPTYTTGQMNALSLDTSGSLRVNVTTGTITASSASTGTDGSTALGFDTQVGGKVTTAAPTYTTGNLNALSLTTLGGLRIDGVYAVATANATAANVANAGGYVTTAAPTYTTGQLNPLSLTTAGALRVDGSATTQPVSGTVTANAGTGNFTVVQATATNLNAAVVGTGTAGTPAGGVLTVQGATGGKPVPVTTDVSSTASITAVAGSTSNTSILASNANRVSATIFNGTNKTMYLALGATASTSSYTLQIFTGSYWELPASYTGAISAVWASGVSGNALVTELT